MKLLLVQADQPPLFYPSKPLEGRSAHVTVVNSHGGRREHTHTVSVQIRNDVTDINLVLKAGPHRAHTELSSSQSIFGVEEEKEVSNHPFWTTQMQQFKKCPF